MTRLPDLLAELHRFEDRGEPAFRRWLFRKVDGLVGSAWRRLLDPRGRRREETWGPEHDVVFSAPSEADDAEARARLREILDGLDEETRAILVLRAQQGLAFREVAARMRLPGADAARMRYARALVVVRERWLEER